MIQSEGNFTNFYVSQKDGDDTRYNGRFPIPDKDKNGPYQSIEAGLDAIEKLRQTGDITPFTVYIVGDYYINGHPITIDSQNNNGCKNVIFESYPDKSGKLARIIGGVKLDSWKKDFFNGVECISSSVEADENGKFPTITELFINGKRADKTRYPQEGTFKVKRTENDSTKVLFSPSKWVEAFPEDLEGIENIEDSTINFYHYWIDEHTPIESYDKTNSRINFKNPSIFAIVSEYSPEWTASCFYYLENIAKAFGKPGMWFYERKKGKLYYNPKNDKDLKSIEAFYASEKRLFQLNGSEDDPICDITIRNIEFFCTSSEYTAFFQGRNFASDEQSVRGAHGSVEVTFVQRCTLKNCTFHGVGLYAVKINEGCHGIRVENNSFYDMGAGAISICGTPAGEKGCASFGNIVRGNIIKGCGKRYAAGCGILVRHSYENEISYNEISDTLYSGISVGWVWGYEDSSTYGNIISYNHIHHIGNGLLSDMGGIYLLGKQQGTVVEYNRIHDVNSAHYGGWGIYTDEG